MDVITKLCIVVTLTVGIIGATLVHSRANVGASVNNTPYFAKLHRQAEVSLSRAGNCTYTWVMTYNVRIRDSKNYVSKTVEECQQLCIDDVYCTGVDYDTVNNICFPYYVGDVVDTQPGFNHYELIRDCPDYISGPCLPECTSPILVQTADGTGGLNRNWVDFKNGFTDASGKNFWIGNDKLHQLTKTPRYKARFEVQAVWDSQWYVSEYNYFIVESEAAEYTLHIFGFLGGNATDGSLIYYADNRMFTTFDRDNDMSGVNCAEVNGGGWWFHEYNYCTATDINGKSGSNTGFTWNGVPDLALLSSRLWLVCR